MEEIDVSQCPSRVYLHFLCVCLLMWLQAVWLQAPKVLIIACVLLIKPILPNILSSDPILHSKSPLLSAVRGESCWSRNMHIFELSVYLNIWRFKKPYTLTCDILFNPCLLMWQCHFMMLIQIRNFHLLAFYGFHFSFILAPSSSLFYFPNFRLTSWHTKALS